MLKKELPNGNENKANDDKKIAANVDYPKNSDSVFHDNSGNVVKTGSSESELPNKSSNALSSDKSGSTQFVNLNDKAEQELVSSPDSSNTHIDQEPHPGDENGGEDKGYKTTQKAKVG